MSRGEAHCFDPTILREYDIRGIVEETLSTDDAYAVGRAFGTEISLIGGATVCVGYDGRLSSPEMEEAVVDGLKDSGMGKEGPRYAVEEMTEHKLVVIHD